jgi:hypothetical protein
LLVVVIGVAVGIGIALNHPREGMYVVCGAMGVAALLRAVLRQRAAGLLVVRSRRTDVVVLLVLCVTIGVFAAITPFHGTA